MGEYISGQMDLTGFCATLSDWVNRVHAGEMQREEVANRIQNSLKGCRADEALYFVDSRVTFVFDPITTKICVVWGKQ